MKPAQKCETDVAFDGKCGIIDSNKCWKGRTTMEKLSRMQQRVYDYIEESIALHGYAPSVREICAAVGLQSTATVHYHLNALRQDGLIEMDGMKKRTITLADSHRADRIPVVGVVTAGLPILAVENIEGYLPWDGEAGCFALRVRGDSMIGVGIMDDDLVIIRQDIQARNGDIVIALLEDEATCKTLCLTPDGVWLRPENPAYPLIDGTGCQILGVVKAVYRDY